MITPIRISITYGAHRDFLANHFRDWGDIALHFKDTLYPLYRPCLHTLVRCLQRQHGRVQRLWESQTRVYSQKRCLCNVGSWLRLRRSHRRPDDIRAQSLTAPVIKTTVCSGYNEIIMTSQLTIFARLCSCNILPHALVMYQSIPVGSGNPIHMSTGVNCHIQRCWLEACWLVSCMTCKDSFNGRAQYTDCKACCQFQQYYMTQIKSC